MNEHNTDTTRYLAKAEVALMAACEAIERETANVGGKGTKARQAERVRVVLDVQKRVRELLEGARKAEAEGSLKAAR